MNKNHRISGQTWGGVFWCLSELCARGHGQGPWPVWPVGLGILVATAGRTLVRRVVLRVMALKK